ncbi:MBL fold metallo-hydrolase [Bacillus timonensis]|nr:MBL fold metallo-hydrolase [Bacillus timonensis]
MEHSSKDTFEHSFLPVTSISSGIGQEILPDVYCYPIQIVNVIFYGNPNNSNEFVLVDAGMPHSSEKIIDEAKKRFGENYRPKAIILTHGHFDHVGALVELIDAWDVPVYAHELELPFLTGQQDYPKGDPTVNGGLVSEMSTLFPNHGIDVSGRIEAMPSDGSVPEMTGWKWIHTPGHTPGHISLFREEDRAMIVGDAFVMVKQESLYKVITQKQEISGPPKYFTTDWKKAKASVENLMSLNPAVAVTGHGFAMNGTELANSLQTLVKQFDSIALPKEGKYLH